MNRGMFRVLRSLETNRGMFRTLQMVERMRPQLELVSGTLARYNQLGIASAMGRSTKTINYDRKIAGPCGCILVLRRLGQHSQET